MKIERMLAIVLLLVNKRRVQAKELAELFEVSIRTIYRDIEAINQAGVPIITYQGVNGGIGLIDSFRLEQNLLSGEELVSITTALKSISTSYQDVHIEGALKKIKHLVPAIEENTFRAKTEKIFVDFSPWGSHSLIKEKYQQIMRAIEKERTITFTYKNAARENSRREVEPHTLVLKGRSWYLYAYCIQKSSFRLFKLIRMMDIATNDHIFQRRPIHLEELPWNVEWGQTKNMVRLLLKIEEKAKGFAQEWFGEDVQTDQSGSYFVDFSLPEDEWLYGFLLSFGASIEIIEPVHIREIVKEKAKRIYEVYET